VNTESTSTPTVRRVFAFEPTARTNKKNDLVFHILLSHTVDILALLLYGGLRYHYIRLTPLNDKHLILSSLVGCLVMMCQVWASYGEPTRRGGWVYSYVVDEGSDAPLAWVVPGCRLPPEGDLVAFPIRARARRLAARSGSRPRP
jgi:hypothetical protein